LIGTFALANVPAVFAKEDASRIYDVSESSELREAIAKIANDAANGQSWFEHDYRPIIIHISLDAESKKIALDMEDRLAGEAGFTEMVDLHRAIEEEIESLQTRVTGRWMFTWTYGGKSLDEIMGDDPISVVSDRARRSWLILSTWRQSLSRQDTAIITTTSTAIGGRIELSRTEFWRMMSRQNSRKNLCTT
jgi:hypothetical protein